MNELCKACGGECCKSLMIRAPGISDEVKAWWEMRGTVAEDVVMLRCRCEHLTKDGRCGIRKTRPQACRDYAVDGPECRQTRRIAGL